MKLCLLVVLACIGSAVSLSYPLQFTFDYQARIAAGIQSNKPQAAESGLKAKVHVDVEDSQGTWRIKFEDVQVGTYNGEVKNDGRAEPPMQYQPLRDASLQEEFKAHSRSQDGRVVMEVPEGELLWVDNVKKGFVNLLRIAPIVQPQSVSGFANVATNSLSGSSDMPKSFSRMEDTFAGHCLTTYSMDYTSRRNLRPLVSDIQSSPSAPRHMSVGDEHYWVRRSIDFSSCRRPVGLFQTGAANLTNVTHSSYRDVAVRSEVSEYLLRGSPEKLRIEEAVSEGMFLMQPYGVESDDAFIVTNQTLKLREVRQSSPASSSASGQMREIKTWNMEMQSPFRQPTREWAPHWIRFSSQGRDSSSPKPVIYEWMTTGYRKKDDQTSQNELKKRIERASQQLDQQNKMKPDSDQYGGSQDGQVAQDLLMATLLTRSLSKEQIKQIDQQYKNERQCKYCYKLFQDIISVAGSGPSVQYLLEKIKPQLHSSNSEIPETHVASMFFSMANNVQSPEALKAILEWVPEIEENHTPLVALLTKINAAIMARRMCMNIREREYATYRYVYGEEMCSQNSPTVTRFMEDLTRKVKSEQPTWVKMLNIHALGHLAHEESLKHIDQILKEEDQYEKEVRLAAIFALTAENYDNSTQDIVFNILQPLVESEAEDYEVREAAISALLTFRPNATLIQRLAMSSYREPSNQVKSYISWVIHSLASLYNPYFAQQISVAKHMSPITFQMQPTVHRSANMIASRYLASEMMGGYLNEAFFTHSHRFFPREIYTYASSQYGGMNIPILENVAFQNSDVVSKSSLRALFHAATGRQSSGSRHSVYYSSSGPSSSGAFDSVANSVMDAARRQEMQRSQSVHNKLSSMRAQQGPSYQTEDEQIPDDYYYLKMFRTSEMFLPFKNQIFRNIQQLLSRPSSRISEDGYDVAYKFFNPVEINTIMPTQTGIFWTTMVESPTMWFLKYNSTGSQQQSNGDLPKINRVDVHMHGIAKAVTKLNSHVRAMVPWNNETVIAGVDNEKTASMPLKFQAQSNFTYPHQILWAQLQPQWQQASGKIPVIAVRNVPYTALASYNSAQAEDNAHDFRTVHWQPSQPEERTFEIPKQYTGIKAAVHYKGEPQNPFLQSRVMNYVWEPLRMAELLASPSIKPYVMCLHVEPQESRSHAIGAYWRYLNLEQEHTNGEELKFPQSAYQPADLNIRDTWQQRVEKFKQWSEKPAEEYSMMVNFTSSPSDQQATYKYEISWAKSFKEQQKQEVSEKIAKHQITILRNFPDSDSSTSPQEKKFALVKVIEKPEPQEFQKVKDIFDQDTQNDLKAKLAANIYEKDIKQQASPVAVLTANLSISEERRRDVEQQTQRDSRYMFDAVQDLFLLAKYDQAYIDMNYTDASSQLLRNLTLRAKDLSEGYLFPHVLINQYAQNRPHNMHVHANRSIVDNQANVYVTLPWQSISIRNLEISSFMDYMTTFLQDPSLAQEHPSRLRSTYSHRRAHSGHAHSLRSSATGSPSDACHIVEQRVRTFDGVSYEKQPSTCFAVATKMESSDKKFSVLVSEKTPSAASEKKVLILSTTTGPVEVLISGKESVKVHGTEQTQPEKTYKNASGKKILEVQKGASFIKVTVPETMTVTVQDGDKVMIKLSPRYKKAVKGLCGDFDFESVEDMTGPEKCVYSPRQGKIFSASWITQKQQCSDASIRPLIQQALGMKQTCTKSRRDLRSSPRRSGAGSPPFSGDQECQVQGYRIKQPSGLYCVSKTQLRLCKPECRVQDSNYQGQWQYNCWDASRAPAELRQKARQGYMEQQPSGQPQYERTLSAYDASKCFHHN